VLVRPVLNDTWVDQANPNSTYWHSESLASDSSPSAITYLRFDMPSAPAGKALKSATVSITTYRTTASPSSSAQAIRVAPDTWTSSTLTYNTRPATTLGTLLGTLPAATRRSTTYTVTLDPALVAANRSSTGHLSVTLTNSGSDQLLICSSDSTSPPPTLTLTYQ